ncbi:MAG: S46 family peptidase [Cyclobacteriaceae bacterium]|nr:S46 family peptidase [Cyclobacteriaceae bacterium]
MKKQILFLLVLFAFGASAQPPADLKNVQPGRFDQGKMWTFENPPVDYFKEAYGFVATEEWLEDARKSALRFASWCSASFISENGLILTNHHCSRGVVASVMKEGENFDANGFYAENLADERRVDNLYVDQLVKVADITSQVQGMSSIEPDSALKVVQKNYEAKDDWKGLHMETRIFYSGGKYSLYGFKRYSDIRLVLYPELALGYFGGDPDNFTYPRYNLDFTLWRAYDENGQPLHPQNYFEFNADGAKENELVFVIGNPGSTGRYLTMAQLYYQRDVSVPAVLSFLRDRVKILMTVADAIDDVYKKDSVVNLAFGLSNADKAYTGRLDGFYDPVLMTKKEKKEDQTRANVTTEGTDPWQALEKNTQIAEKYYAESLLLAPYGTRGKVNQLVNELYDYKNAMTSENQEAIDKAKEDIGKTLSSFDKSLERALYTALLEELNEHSRQDYIAQLLGGKSPSDKTEELFATSLLLNDQDKFFKLKAKKLDNEPLMQFAEVMVPKYEEASNEIKKLTKENKKFEEKIANLQFGLTGLSSPPDATFSLRLADGVVKGYSYNGTEAPYFTTYFGLYDRYYSHEKKYPWDLPAKWLNPSMDLLKSPLDFVCTADIIGGNSGSPVINAKQEVVGLVFDGNIESLPGYFIYDSTSNRTVAVHAGGILAALKYVYNANRIVKELE